MDERSHSNPIVETGVIQFQQLPNSKSKLSGTGQAAGVQTYMAIPILWERQQVLIQTFDAQVSITH
jgi:hypothetical protein